MRISPLSRASMLLLTTLAAFGGGATSHYFWPRDARAQAIAHASTIYVPADGLVFRTIDGKPIARLSHGTHGGVLELYDDRQEAAARFSSGTIGATRSSAREPYVLDEEDPWIASPAKVHDRGAVF
jgi:hypothetical protein